MGPAVIGHYQPVQIFLDRLHSGRFPHAWLFDGPEGIGKSMVAQNLAGVVLGSESDVKNGDFYIHSDDITRKMISGSHSDYRYIRRSPDENGKTPQFISVDSIRKMNHFFELKASERGFRVAIVDAVDELNTNSANALLKTLEEPPERSLIILIHHGSRAILPTIRSRCVRLKFQPLTDEDLKRTLPDDSKNDVMKFFLPLSDGSPGRLQNYIQADPEGSLPGLIDRIEAKWPLLTTDMLSLLQTHMTRSETHFELGIRGLDRFLQGITRSDEGLKSVADAAKVWASLKLTVSRAEVLKLDLNERCAACLTQLLKLSQKSGEAV